MSAVPTFSPRNIAVHERVNVATAIRPHKSILRNATVIHRFVAPDGTNYLVVTHRNERFPVAVNVELCTPYIPRTRKGSEA